jgi:hypothetical protein
VRLARAIVYQTLVSVGDRPEHPVGSIPLSNGAMFARLVSCVRGDGELIHMTFTGVRDDANQYFRTVSRCETAAPKYAFLNHLLALGLGEIRADGPIHVIEEVL